MNLNGKTIGFGLTGSFCTFESVFIEMRHLCDAGANVIPIFSFSAQSIDTRFGTAADFLADAKAITGHSPICTIKDAEPIGPKGLLDLLLIAPATGNTIAKLANAITDTPVLMAAKAHLRNQRPLVVALSTNDALGMNFRNIGALCHVKNLYLVPFGQDQAEKKPESLVAHMPLILSTIEQALDHTQLQPLLF
ncbi:MAG: dipicolinate synthase subunit B [Lachnospiraceae bacterium]